MGNYIHHIMFDTYRVDILPSPSPSPPPTYYETSIAWELLKFTGMAILMVIASIIGFIVTLIIGLTRWR